MFNAREIGWEIEAVENEDGEVADIYDDVAKVMLTLGSGEAIIW